MSTWELSPTSETCRFGFATRNVFGGNVALNQPREWTVGGRLSYNNSLYFSTASYSTLAALKPYQVGFGAEYVTPYYFVLKAGYRFQPSGPLSAWSGGLSFNAPKIGFHYVVEFPNTAGLSPEHLLGVTLLL